MTGVTMPAGMAFLPGRSASQGSRVHKRSGFTLPELVVTMVIIGILAVVIAPRFAQKSTFDVFGFTEQAREALRYAQKSAIAKRRSVCVGLTSSTLTLTVPASFGGTCSQALIDPSTGQALSQSVSSTLTVSAASFYYDASGAPSAAQTITVTDGTSTQTITVEAGTGYVH